MAVGQLEQMIRGPGQKFTRYAVCCQHARDLGQDFKATLKQAGRDKDRHTDDQGCCALERRPAVEDERKDDGFDRPDQARTDRRKHHIRMVWREVPRRRAKPGKRHPALAFALPFHHRQLAALAGEEITQAPGRAAASGRTARTINWSATGKAEAAQDPSFASVTLSSTAGSVRAR